MTENPYRNGGIFLIISAALNILAPFVTGFASVALMMVPVGIAYLILAAGLMRAMRWVAYIAFLVVLIGLSSGIAGYYGSGPVPGWVHLGIIIAHVLGALFLFLALWRAAPPRAI